MDINKYILFADVANTKNFTKSGERMGYTQPGVSHVLKAMEWELGFSLFLRTPKGVTLTSDAEAILPLVRELLAVNEQLEQTVSQINGLEKGHLCIASFASISRSWLPQVFYAFKLKYPGIEIELLEGGTDDHTVISMVSNHLGVSILPNLVIGTAKDKVLALPLEPYFPESWESVQGRIPACRRRRSGLCRRSRRHWSRKLLREENRKAVSYDATDCSIAM